MTYDIKETSEAEFDAVGTRNAAEPYDLWFWEGGKFYRARFGEFGTLPPEFDYLYLRASENGPNKLHLPEGGEETEFWCLETDVPGERDRYERQVSYGPWKKVGTLPSPLAKYRERRAELAREASSP